ncbi:hypothetical protein ZWY2020_039740 [Hordeum vulgare]|nr:hypothetical protein ZWY2020_039740 [Hordeum vulgare]
MLTLFARNNVRAISQIYINIPNDGSTTVFGERRANLPRRKYVTRPGFQTDPWGRGVAPFPPQPGVAELIEQFFTFATHSELARNYLVHEEPRFIRITRLDIRDQLARTKEISHELMSVLLRHFAQLGTLVLSDSDFQHTISIQKQLSVDSLKFDITSSQMPEVPEAEPAAPEQDQASVVIDQPTSSDSVQEIVVVDPQQDDVEATADAPGNVATADHAPPNENNASEEEDAAEEAPL